MDELEGIDEDAGWVYFTGTRDSALERHLYRQSLSSDRPDEPQRISVGTGSHAIAMNKTAEIYVDTHSTPDQPPQVSLHQAEGKKLAWLLENTLDDSHPYAPYLDAHRPTKFGTLQAEDDQTLHYRLTLPPDLSPGKRHPAMVYVYGGPGAQVVSRSWHRRLLLDQFMAQQGFVVFAIDNRGSGRRGTAFENPIYRSMGMVEVADQVVGARYLASLDYVDARRIGVFGWSYGGYMTLHMMFRHPDVFAAGVSVAPVTDWAIYDTHYTERFMSTPEENAEGYRQGSVFPYTEGFDRPLLVIHGMADDNVLFTNSTKLFRAPAKAGGVVHQHALPRCQTQYFGPGSADPRLSHHQRISETGIGVSDTVSLRSANESDLAELMTWFPDRPAV